MDAGFGEILVFNGSALRAAVGGIFLPRIFRSVRIGSMRQDIHEKYRTCCAMLTRDLFFANYELLNPLKILVRCEHKFSSAGTR
jgi:hypothetical protein